MLTTVEGVYRDGRVELSEVPKVGFGRRVLVTFLESNGATLPPTPHGQMIRQGMFPQLLSLTDEDFKSAEFHGDRDDGLGWSGL